MLFNLMAQNEIKIRKLTRPILRRKQSNRERERATSGIDDENDVAAGGGGGGPSSVDQTVGGEIRCEGLVGSETRGFCHCYSHSSQCYLIVNARHLLVFQRFFG
jgi:hypothetical protein